MYSTRKQKYNYYSMFFQKYFSDMNDYIDVILTREEIANTLGTATESVIRLLSGFKSQNIIKLKGKKILILDRNVLKNISEGF